MDGGRLLSQLEADGKVTLELNGESVELTDEDVQVRLQAKEGWAAAQGRGCVVVLSTELTENLIREGVARDLVRLIQDRRKELDCEFTDRICVGIVTESVELTEAISENVAYIKSETLANDVVFAAIDGVEPFDLEVAGYSFKLYVQVVSP
jgi:isoleucyl-tRNA synthetase